MRKELRSKFFFYFMFKNAPKCFIFLLSKSVYELYLMYSISNQDFAEAILKIQDMRIWGIYSFSFDMKIKI